MQKGEEELNSGRLVCCVRDVFLCPRRLSSNTDNERRLKSVKTHFSGASNLKSAFGAALLKMQ